MIVDLAESPPDAGLRYDLCILGSGPAGMTVVAELAGSGLRICVLESGRRRTTRFADDLRGVASEGIEIKDYSRERTLGGTSTTWAGLSSPLDDVDLTERPFLRRSGWPLSREDLLPWWQRAGERYRFAPLELYEDFVALADAGDRRFAWPGLDEKVFLACAEAQDFGREWKHVFDREGVDLYLDATVLRLEGAEPAAHGAADGAADGASHGAADVRVRRAVGRTSAGREFAVEARVFVVAAGGIENARLLLASTDLQADGLGNAHDQVGRHLMNHPKNYGGLVHLAEPVRELPYQFGCLYEGYAGYAGLRLPDDAQRQQRVLNSYVRFEPLFPWSDNRGVESLVLLVKRSKGFYGRFKEKSRGKIVTLRDYSETGDDSDLQNERKGVLGWLGVVGAILIHLPMVLRYLNSRLREGAAPAVSTIRLRNFMEMEPDPDNRVLLGDDLDALGQRRPIVRHAPTELDKRSLVALHEAFAQELLRTGAGRLESDLDAQDPWPVDLDASHHMGTTRMGDDPATSVVDRTQRVHGVANVFCAGASVFPTSGCANPTFTICALSMRLARHLATTVFADRVAEDHAPVPPKQGSSGGEAAKRFNAPALAASRRRRAENGLRRVIVIGAGGRVVTDVLPALLSQPETFELAGVFARTERSIELTGRSGLAGTRVDVLPLDRLGAADVTAADLVCVSVTKQAVPKVLGKLSSLPRRGTRLLVDTPPVLFKQAGKLGVFEGWSSVDVAEDCATLPWIDLVREAGPELIGSIDRVVCHRSAWRYHGHGLLKALLGCRQLSSARRRGGRIELNFADGGRGVIVEPRDYAAGHFEIHGPDGVITDSPARLRAVGVIEEGARVHELALLTERGRARGFRLGRHETVLTPGESELLGPVEPGDTITTRMDDLKRVGLARLQGRVAHGESVYPLEEGLDDMAVDFLLEKLKIWRPSPFTSLRSRSGRRLIGGALRLARR